MLQQLTANPDASCALLANTAQMQDTTCLPSPSSRALLGAGGRQARCGRHARDLVRQVTNAQLVLPTACGMPAPAAKGACALKARCHPARQWPVGTTVLSRSPAHLISDGALALLRPSVKQGITAAEASDSHAQLAHGSPTLNGQSYLIAMHAGAAQASFAPRVPRWTRCRHVRPPVPCSQHHTSALRARRPGGALQTTARHWLRGGTHYRMHPSHIASMMRLAPLVLPAGAGCHSQLWPSHDSCPGGELRVHLLRGAHEVAAPKTSQPMHMTVAFPSLTLTVVSNRQQPLAGVIPASTAALTVGEALKPAGCNASSPFMAAAGGTISPAAGAVVASLSCLSISFSVSVGVTEDSVTSSAQCMVTSTTGSHLAPMATRVAVGDGHTCMLVPPAAGASVDIGGHVVCHEGVVPHASGHSSALTADAGRGFLQVAAGTSHTCALQSDGAVLCVGAASGLGAGNEHVAFASSHERFVALAATDDFTCGISAGRQQSESIHGRGLLMCRGGNARLSAAFAQRQAIWAAHTVAAIALSPTAACAILQSPQRLECFGRGMHSLQSSKPTSGAFVAVAVGEGGDACAIREGDGALLCWGPQWAGGSHTYNEAYEAVAIGTQWLCAVRRSIRRLQCFGRFVPAVFPSYDSVPQEAVSDIAARGNTLCVVRHDRTAACYGTLARSSTPVVPTLL